MLTEEQKLRLELFNASEDLVNAKKAYEFIMWGSGMIPPIEVPVLSAIPNEQTIEDGIYFVCNNGMKVKDTIENREVLNKCLVNGIGVKMGRKSLVVQLWEVQNGEEVPLTLHTSSEYDCEGGIYVDNQNDVHTDWDGHFNTAHLKRIGCPPLGNGYIPSLAQMLLISMFRMEISRALEFVDARPLAFATYWSSSEHSKQCAWTLNMRDDCVDIAPKDTFKALIRPVTDFIV